jgi:hypothetical protein
MPASPSESKRCRACGAVHEIFRRPVPLRNHGLLRCRQCEAELVVWYGHFIYSFEADPPDSAEMADFDTVMNLPAQKPREE